MHRLAPALEAASPDEVVRLLHDEDAKAVAAVGEVLSAVSLAASTAARCLRAGGRLIYLGAGTSGRLGMLDSVECPPTFGTSPRQVTAIVAGGPAALVRSVEGAEDDGRAGAAAIRRARVGPLDFVVGIAASSATPFVVGALEAARRAGATTGLLCCNRSAVPEGLAHVVIAPDTGAELIAGSTRLKAGTATKLVLNAISTAAMVQLGKVYRGRMVDLAAVSVKLRARAERMVAELCRVGAARARRLLLRAAGRPAVAIAMHLTGRGAHEARRALDQAGSLSALERQARRRRVAAGMRAG